MLAEDVLKREPIVLTQAQRQHYFDHGYLHLDGFISDEWMQRLARVTDRFVEDSRAVTHPDRVYDLEPNHSAEAPRLRRLNQPAELDPVYREFALEGPIVDLAEDLLGPDVKYHHSKLNFKWASGGEEVKWHQDIQFWPHTNYSPLTIGVYMNDVTDEMGPMGIIPGSHKGELFDLFDEDRNWTGAIRESELDRVALDDVVWLKGRRGSVTVHNCRIVHGSEPNRSASTRPLLLHTYASADALPICASIADGFPLANTIVRGKPARWMRFDPRPCLIPPDWSKGYSSIFALQQSEAAE
ncbi:phytanoyl-CoA dioxygenase family protein [Minwuia sp.]|uniref:phytanoyl-CoA dioxygenase family protein n=1 Tax=Minwuia sp. TaxID=2493630 RepID=UPI003A911EDC